ncbi:hypothetical protein COZ41_02245 [Candidatus Shapirobacteria bacterium CG_4_10_14_3_um_filter_35_13]|uniref:Peptidase M23 domain-containing protein n=4 Tax=Candidatus Shapironibacteriota TaxID=1752721 RepID=A0A2M7LIQ4_9BACT|nr:MAG: hypothetical protein COZ41_02245 [Candidatus Shapirobacteria bacterium CG_4_10_14_3_um_filter_35_13]
MVVILFLFYFIFRSPIYAVTEADSISAQIEIYATKLTVLRKQKNSLSKELDIINTTYSQTELKIKQTELSIKILTQEIDILNQDIAKLDNSINQTTLYLLERIKQSYRLSKKMPPYAFIFSHTFNDYLNQHKYISIVQLNNRQNIEKDETMQQIKKNKKQELSNKQEQLTVLEKKLSVQRIDLISQKKIKNKLLSDTKNEESRYQALLAQAQAELYAIEQILVGNGEEVEVGNVAKGDKIATVIQGQSCSSGGTHIHFMVKNNNTTQNPFSYLKNGISYQDFSVGDPFNPSGSWDWPIKEKIDFNQGYGKTWSVAHTWVGKIYQFHNGIDITSESDQKVYSSISGKLFRGKFNTKSCVLKYVRVQDSANSSLSTLSLHVNYF